MTFLKQIQIFAVQMEKFNLEFSKAMADMKKDIADLQARVDTSTKVQLSLFAIDHGPDQLRGIMAQAGLMEDVAAVVDDLEIMLGESLLHDGGSLWPDDSQGIYQFERPLPAEGEIAVQDGEFVQFEDGEPDEQPEADENDKDGD